LRLERQPPTGRESKLGQRAGSGDRRAESGVKLRPATSLNPSVTIVILVIMTLPFNHIHRAIL
jgi:hypothetical protein